MPLVLAIEPDLRQAAIVKRIVREKVLADVAVVDSRDAALEAMRTTVPDVLLISALLSPRDEDELVAHLRTLDDADHLQTHTIPQLASTLGPGERPASRGLLSAFRRKKDPEVAPSGCDPDVFAEEIRSYLQRAADRKRERLDEQKNADPQDHAWRAAAPSEKEPALAAEPADAPSSGSSWASPFEWKPSNPSSLIAPPEPPVAGPLTLMAHLRPQGAIAATDSLIAPQPLEEPVRVETAVEVKPVAPLQESTPVQEVVVPIQAVAPIQDAGSRIPDSGLGIRDKRSAIRDSSLGPLAGWARAEGPERNAARGSDDLHELLTGLAVPSAVVAVGYGRGCRIRRVRVPAARESQEAEAVGVVVLSKRLLAEQRERREQPQA